MAKKIVSHPLAVKRGWKAGVDYPVWGNNAYYLTTIQGSYLVDKETPRDAYIRLATTAAMHLANADQPITDPEQTSILQGKFLEILWNGWLIPSTPVMCNMGTDRGLPISCFSGVVGDDMYDIYRKNTEMAMLSKYGGGTAYDFSNVRAKGSLIKQGQNGTSDGIIPFIKSYDSTILASKQGKTRRGAVAIYLDSQHAEYPEFLRLRTGQGEVNRQCNTIHQGSKWSDEMMELVKAKKGKERDLWLETLKTRVKTGEPYIFFTDNANKNIPQFWKDRGLSVKHSNLCVAPETKILTKLGYEQISDLVGENIDIWNGREWSNVDIVQTGTNQKLLKVELDNGIYLEVTPYHKWYVFSYKGNSELKYKEVRTNELKIGDRLIKFDLPIVKGSDTLSKAYTNGFYSGDGCYFKNKSIVYLYTDKKLLEPYLEVGNSPRSENETRITFSNIKGLQDKFFVPSSNYTISSRLEWFAGLLDSDGCVVRNGDNESLQIGSIHISFLKDTQLMLQTLGIHSKVKVAKEASITSMPKNDGSGEYADYNTKKLYRLLISSNGLYKLIQLGLCTNRLRFDQRLPQRNAEHFVKIVSISDENRYDDTFCFNETKRHMGIFNGVLTGNCSEIFLPTDENHTLVCCLSSMNLHKWDEWKDTEAVYYATMFLDSVITEFLIKSADIPGVEDARSFAAKSRALGLGALGWHTLLQSKNIPFVGIMANSLTRIIFKHMRDESKRSSVDMAVKYGEPEWCEGQGIRNLTNLAIAPNKSSADLGGGLSESTGPIVANITVEDKAKGLHIKKNPILEAMLEEKGLNTNEVWDMIEYDSGSVRNIKGLSKDEKEIFYTAREINQLELVRQAGIRQEFLDQGQSINLFFYQDAEAKWINKVHLEAHEVGLKSLYYLKSESNLKADKAMMRDLYSECLSCEG